MVPFSSFARVAWVTGPTQVVGFNGYPAVRLTGEPAPATPGRRARRDGAPHGHAAGRIRLRVGRPVASGEARGLAGGLPARVVDPVRVPVPRGPLRELDDSPRGDAGGAARHCRLGGSGLPAGPAPTTSTSRSGFITIIGLSAKNAILIIEFANDLRAQGNPLVEATLEAAELRFRPILMTSLAFILGVVPLVIASGASAMSQQALGTGVLAA